MGGGAAEGAVEEGEKGERMEYGKRADRKARYKAVALLKLCVSIAVCEELRKKGGGKKRTKMRMQMRRQAI